MLYSEILRVLPKDVSDLLQAKLDAAPFTEHMTPQEATLLVEAAVEQTKSDLFIRNEEVERMAHFLLAQVPQAAVKALFA